MHLVSTECQPVMDSFCVWGHVVSNSNQYASPIYDDGSKNSRISVWRSIGVSFWAGCSKRHPGKVTWGEGTAGMTVAEPIRSPARVHMRMQISPRSVSHLYHWLRFLIGELFYRWRKHPGVKSHLSREWWCRDSKLGFCGDCVCASPVFSWKFLHYCHWSTYTR